MFPEQLKRILNLVKKTGDRVVIYDASRPDESYVVMDISGYERMIGLPENKDDKPKSEIKSDLTEEDLTDRINREISIWKNQENPSFLSEEDKAKKPWAISKEVKEKAREVE